GSYETWSRIMGGVLEVAGIEGFLANLDEMLAAADGEGAIWRSFVAAWWDRFGTAEVGTGDLYEVALACEPPLPLGSGGDRSQRTRLGKALARMRDRVFDIDGRKMRVRTLGVSHQAKRWQLTIEGERGERFPQGVEAQAGERCGQEGNVENQRSPAQPLETKGSGERGEHGERFSILTHARGCTRAIEDREQRSPCSPPSQSVGSSNAYDGEPGGERPPSRSPDGAAPDWLKEVL
ncbi:MAG TPA: hypothetical protein PK264_10090, partial [Hyphomicrobiaceae bacterium]|nr:hypothetical protein [Hyphomicrobiaceae bacterium]